MPFELTRPLALVAILFAAPVLVYFYRYSLSDFPRRQRMVSLATRAVIIGLLVLSLAGLVWLRSTDERFVVILVDQSLSVGENAVDRVNEFMDATLNEKHQNRVAFLPFAAEAGEIQDERVQYGDAPSILAQRVPQAVSAGQGAAAEPAGPPAGNPPAGGPPAGDWPAGDWANASNERRVLEGTNLAAAIEAAAGFIPPGYLPQMIVLSDGNQTDGDALAAATRSQIPISTVPLPVRSDPEAQVSEVVVPAEVREGEPFLVEVVVHSNHDDEGRIEVYRGDHKVIEETRPLKAGENRFQFEQSIERVRLASYAVRLSQLKEDTLLDNNFESGLVYAAGKPRVVVVESDPNLIRELAYALEDEGIEVDVRPPQGMPDSLADLQNYELLMLSNVAATALTQQQMNVVRTYVQELGGGFIMLGGEQSFGLGGYYKSALEEILPVRSDFEKEKETPSLGMVLVIDKSGSMQGDKIEMAKSAARSAAELLGRRDQLAVLAFDGETYVISEMQSAINKGKISNEISQIDAGGGTVMYPAMEMAYEILSATSAKLKHVILLTDGVSSPGDFEGMAQQMVSSKMTVSAVAVGESSDTDLLETIARAGRGRYYFTDDPSQVPQIFAKETVTASKSAIDEQPFLPQVVRKTHSLSGIDLDAAPFLLGYVMTRPKPTCELILATEKGDPLLAWWRYGLGMSAAFTSDAKSRWAAEWMTWPGFGQFWTQVIRQTMRTSNARGIVVDASRHGSRVDVTLDAVNELGRFMNTAEVELTVIDPRLQRTNTALLATAPGRYTADFETPHQGAYHLEFAVKQHGQIVYRQSRGMTIGYSDELRLRPTNDGLLRSIADASGGKFDPDPASIFETQSGTTTRPTPLWPYLATLAVCLLVLDVALRRIDFSLFKPALRHG